ncbi:MAG: hypothetical protein WBO25_10590 [Acidimicrobiia bacterium]
MHRHLPPRLLTVFVVVVALFVAACSPSADSTTTSSPPATTTDGGGEDPTTTAGGGEGSTTTAGGGEGSTTTSTVPASDVTISVPGTASESIDPAVVDEMRSELAALMVEAEQVRGIPFIATPTVVILDEAEFSQRVTDLVAEDLDKEDLANDSAFFAMLGMLDPGTDLYQLLIDLYTEQVAGFYDGDTEEMVVPAAPDGFTALQRLTVLHELVHALTDQHFDFNDEFEVLIDEGNGDDSSAFQALIEGDATRSQFVYMEGMSPIEAVEAATEALSYDSSVLDSVPEWIQSDLTFPYDQGLFFVEAITATGGLAAVDEAYQNPPQTTEQVLDPARYARSEPPRELAPLTVQIDGWDLYDEATFGDWGLRLLLDGSVSPGEVTQAASGWGNDTYRVFTRGDDVAMVMSYIGDSERDAEELANALIAHIRDDMDSGPAEESADGLLYRQGNVYSFIDRIGDGIYWIVSTDKSAGEDIRQQLGI